MQRLNSYSEGLLALLSGFLGTVVYVALVPTYLYAGPWDEHGQIAVSKQNPHYLAYEDGTPFFWLGDTAWSLFARLGRGEAADYLRHRSRDEFNVIQAVVLWHREGLTRPNAHGDLPLISGDPSKLNVTPGNDFGDPDEYDYFDHVEYILEEAQRLGMYVGLLPCWGEFVVPRQGFGIFDTGGKAYSYGRFLGGRYGKHPNIIWILGGDREPDERLDGVALWRAMAEGIADGINGVDTLDGHADYSTSLMTHHSYGSSSQWFHEDAWIDFHTWGSYHADYYLARAYLDAEKDRALPSPKPTLNSEPAYEEHPLNYIENNGFFHAFDVRQIAYWSVFAGTLGHTYGAHPVWQFYESGPPQGSFTKSTWRAALEFDGAKQMKFLKRLMLSRPMHELVPDQSLIAGGQAEGSGHVRAIRGNSFAFIYIPTGAVITVEMGRITGSRVLASWYDPRTAEVQRIGEFENLGRQSFDPPGISEELEWLQTGRGCDWVLVLDGVER